MDSPATDEPRTDHAGCLIIDLPGTYSLASRSPDEHVARQVVLGQIQGTPRPDVVVVVADASNLERNLYLVTQVLELGRPCVVALSMVDVAKTQGKTIDLDKLSRHLRVPVVGVQAHKSGEVRGAGGIYELKQEIARAGRKALQGASHPRTQSPRIAPPRGHGNSHQRLKKILADEGLCTADQAYFDAHLMITTGEDEGETDALDAADARRKHPKVRLEISAALAACEAADIDPISAEVEAHYGFITSVVNDCVRENACAGQTKFPALTKLTASSPTNSPAWRFSWASWASCSGPSSPGPNPSWISSKPTSSGAWAAI